MASGPGGGVVWKRRAWAFGRWKCFEVGSKSGLLLVRAWVGFVSLEGESGNCHLLVRQQRCHVACGIIISCCMYVWCVCIAAFVSCWVLVSLTGIPLFDRHSQRDDVAPLTDDSMA
jgi:hypothetical protein